MSWPDRKNREWRLLCATAVILLTPRSVLAQMRGEADVALQGYYLGTEMQPMNNTSGLAIKLKNFIPNVGLLNVSLEGYYNQGKFQPGDNFIELNDAVWRGMRWNLTGGDFRVSGTLLPSPFFNLFFPEVAARGFRIEAGDSTRKYALFYGSETLMAGPRIPFRISVPQNVLGASVRQKLGRLELGVRYLRFSTSEKSIQDNPYFFPVGRDFQKADNLTFTSTYSFTDRIRWYSEATATRSAGPTGHNSVSVFFGPVLETEKVTVRANYAYLGPAYLPVAGYFIGDRRGPFGEVRVKPRKWLELYGSASQYTNNLTNNPEVTDFRTTGTSAGVSLQLPWKFSASAQLSTLAFSASNPSAGTSQRSDNQQWNLSVSRPIRNHTIRFTGRDFRMRTNEMPQRQKSAEVEDTFQLSRFSFGGALRAQRADAVERRNSLFGRGSAQVRLGRLSAYGYLEIGKDLANQTVFATNTTSTSVVGLSARLTKEWNLQVEGFRTRLLTELNAENTFVLETQGVAVSPILNNFNQWSFLFRLSRSFRWGGALPGGGSLAQFASQQLPLTGSIEGAVFELTGEGRRTAPGVPVTLVDGTTVFTDAAGRFRFEDVREGSHTVTIATEQLPADYNPGPNPQLNLTVSPRRTARAELDVYPLGAFRGKIVASPGSTFETLEGILIRLLPGSRYTTTLRDGTFVFYNLSEGSYELTIAEETLPSNATLTTAPQLTLVIQTNTPPPMVQFEIAPRPMEEKRIRKVLEQQILLDLKNESLTTRPHQPPQN